ncbi:MAG: methionine gamma-lyase family protein [Bacilli bacterium]|nr:methionine gamma-lyase family protein [Bacilli bacterium]
MNEILELINKSEIEIKDELKKIDEIVLFNSMKVLDAFQKEGVSEYHFNSTTGYGYNDIGRDVIEKVYSNIFKSEDALVRSQFISGSHALATALFGVLRPNDIMLCITGTPYDTLHEVIGIKDNSSSLKSFGVKYEEIDLVDNGFDYEKIINRVKENDIKVIYIQRSKGYSTRKSLSIQRIENIISKIREVNKDAIIMIDNCYCELVNKKEPIEVGADVCVGSLIKNLGGGIAPNGGYVVGRKDLIELISERLTVPGEGKEVGPSLGANKSILQGLYSAPSVVGSALKTAILTSYVLQNKGYDVEPKYNEERVDIVQNIIFNDPDKLIKYCQGIQMGSAIDSNAIPEASDMPGYDDKVIMASGSFTQGSSIELSCDGPLRPPYIAYQQGSLTFEYGKLGLARAIERLEK